MPGMINRIKELAKKEKEEWIPLELSRLQEPAFEKEGDASYALISNYRFIAVADYVETGNIELFRQHLKTAVHYQLNLLKRRGQGEPVMGASLPAFRSIFNALASGDWQLTQELIKIMDSFIVCPRERAPKEFAFGFYRIFKAFIVEPTNELSTFIETMLEYFQAKMKAYVGYPLVFRAIYEKDEKKLEQAFVELLKGHKLLCREGKKFGDTEDEIICIWGLGMANLARFKGLNPRINSPFIPPELIVSPK